MTLTEKLKSYHLILAGITYAILALIFPMASQGIALIAVIFSPITMAVGFLFSFLYRLFIMRTWKTSAEILFWTGSLLIYLFTFSTFPWK